MTFLNMDQSLTTAKVCWRLSVVSIVLCYRLHHKGLLSIAQPCEWFVQNNISVVVNKTRIQSVATVIVIECN